MDYNDLLIKHEKEEQSSIHKRCQELLECENKWING